MTGGFRIITFVLLLSLCCGELYLSAPSFAAAGISLAVLDRLEKLRFGHTNQDIRLKERLNVLEWSVMGSRQPGSMSERLAAVEQKLDSEGSATSNSFMPTYNPARPRTGYLPGRRSKVVSKTRKKIVVATATRLKTFSKPKAVAPVLASSHLHSVSPKLITGLIKKGNNLYISGDYHESIEELTRAIKLDPSYAPAYVCRGYAYGKLGRADMEKSDFELAKKLDSRIQLPM